MLAERECVPKASFGARPVTESPPFNAPQNDLIAPVLALRGLFSVSVSLLPAVKASNDAAANITAASSHGVRRLGTKKLEK